MQPFGVPELFFLGPILFMVLGLLLGPVFFWWSIRRRAKRLGYPTTGAYLRAVPRSDPERRDAADLALKGLLACGLGLVFAPLVLVGLVPLFYGARKVINASMGLGLVDDEDRPDA